MSRCQLYVNFYVHICIFQEQQCSVYSHQTSTTFTLSLILNCPHLYLHYQTFLLLFPNITWWNRLQYCLQTLIVWYDEKISWRSLPKIISEAKGYGMVHIRGKGRCGRSSAPQGSRSHYDFSNPKSPVFFSLLCFVFK